MAHIVGRLPGPLPRERFRSHDLQRRSGGGCHRGQGCACGTPARCR